jgi:SAM-dependent methyltransferase
MNSMERFYPESKFGGFTDIDGTMAFFSRVNSLLEPSFVVLDIGCGRGAYGADRVSLRKDLRIMKGKAAKVIGVDVDENARENPYLDEFHLVQGYTWPIHDHTVDLIICDFVLEHVDAPEKFFAEISRVLKPGGYLCIRTPNVWSYVSFAAALIPNRYHSKVTSIVQSARKEEDVFPTLYKCNSVGKIKSIMEKSGFECVVYAYEAEPSYLSFSTIAYYFGILHQRYAPRFLKPTIFAFGRMKKEQS